MAYLGCVTIFIYIYIYICGDTYQITVFIGEEDTMVNKILVVDKIVHLGPPLGHCRELLYKIVW